MELPHRQFAFMVPETSRLYFKNDNRLFGEFARFHSLWHVLVLEGGFDEWGRFVETALGLHHWFVETLAGTHPGLSLHLCARPSSNSPSRVAASILLSHWNQLSLNPSGVAAYCFHLYLSNDFSIEKGVIRYGEVCGRIRACNP